VAAAVCATPFCGNPSGFATVAPCGAVGAALFAVTGVVVPAGAVETAVFAADTSVGLLAEVSAAAGAAPVVSPSGFETVATGDGGGV
jgi:hypothetical protein